MDTLLSSDGLMHEISDIVAEASMLLPPLVRPTDKKFLLDQTAKAIAIFVDTFIASIDPEDRAAFLAARESGDAPLSGAILSNALGARDAEGHAQKALDTARSQIAASIVDEYHIAAAHLSLAA